MRRRAMTLFFSFVLVSIFTLPNPSSANNILFDNQQVASQFIDYCFPYYSVGKKLSEQIAYPNENKTFSQQNSSLNQNQLQKLNIDISGEQIHTLDDILHGDDEFLPIINDVEVHDNMIWTIEFNDEMNPSTITNKTLFILNSDGERVPTLIINDSMRTINILAPVDKYEVGETYYLYLTNEIESSTGEKMQERFILQFFIQNIDSLETELSQSIKLNFSFETGYEGTSIDIPQPVQDEREFLNQVNDEMNELQLDDDFLMILMKKFDELEEQKL